MIFFQSEDEGGKDLVEEGAINFNTLITIKKVCKYY